MVNEQSLNEEEILEGQLAEGQSSLTSFVESYCMKCILVCVMVILTGILFITINVRALTAVGFLLFGAGWIGFLVTVVRNVSDINKREERIREGKRA